MQENDYKLSMEQIAASLAHEVKNPLSLVKANIDFLELNDEDTLHKRNYGVMRRELDRINELLLDFIQFTKPSGLNFRQICLNDSMEDILDSFRLSYAGKIAVQFNPLPGPVYVLADEWKLARVFVNILKNAAEAMESKPDGTIRIDFTKNDDFLSISFADNGKGLTPEEAMRISEPFFTTKRGGSGLGIYVSKSIVEEHGGKLLIAVNEGGGCTVTVCLPLCV